MKTSKRGKAITNIALVTIMVASVMVAMIGGAGAATSADGRYNEIAKQTEAQTVLIGQDLRFVGYWVEAPVIGRLVSGDLENTYKATESGGTYYVYNVNWPTSGAFYVNYVKIGTTVTFDAQLSVEDPKMPLKLKVKDKEVSSIARSTKLNIDVGGINLDDKDVVDLVIIGPNGQITEKKGQPFKDITVGTLKDFNNGNAIDTTGWDVGKYTFQVKTVPEKACNLDYQSVKKELNMIKGTVQIKADTTEVPEITVVQLAVTGVAGHHITVAPVPVSKNAYFPAGLDDNPRAADTLWFNDVIDDDGTRTYAVEFNDTGTYIIRVTDLDADTYDSVDITVLRTIVNAGRRHNEIDKQTTEAQIVLIGQDLLFKKSVWGVNAPVISRVVSGDLENTYKATTDTTTGDHYIYNVNWPTTGAFYVNYVKNPDSYEAQLSVEKTVHILNYTDYGIDTDGDGKYDYLAIDVGVDVKTAGKYRIEGSLKDHSTGDHIVSASTDRILDVGVQDVTLKFNGYPIYRHGASVNFDLKDLKVSDKDWNRLDYRSFAYTTSYYSYTYFDVPPADITGSYSNYGIDTDSDGKYNHLAIDVWVNVKEAGYYRLGGWLDEDGNKHITYASASSHLNKGLQKVTLQFNVYEIYRRGVNAQFVLGYLGLKDEDWNIVDQKWDAYTTSFYYYTDFDKPPADLTGSYSDYGIDADGDGKYDYLAIDVWVNVKEEGYYDVSGWLDDSYGHDITYDWNCTYLEEGLQKLTLEFNGYEIYRQGVSGSFNLGHVKLRDRNEIEEKWDVYSTANYAYTNFDEPPIDLTGAYVDYGVDTDGNGKYDYLAIDVGVNVKEAGTYSVSGNVYDNENEGITGDWDEIELSKGLQKLTLKFEGYTIYRNGVDGPFLLDSVSLSDEWNKADYEYVVYFTSYYNHTEFDRKFTGEFNDYGVDTDGDGLYNYLEVVAEVNITKAGEYRLSGYLGDYEIWLGSIAYNPEGVVYDSNITYLETGIHNIMLQFDGIEIYTTQKYSGSFNKVGLELYDTEEENWIDGMEYFTNDYDYTDFQKPPAEFAQGFNDYGLDTNGNSLYDYLVIEKEILVREAGNYRLRGWLKSTSVETIDYDDNNTYLDVGLHSITLQFYGPSIYNSEESDNFEVQLHLYDGDSGERLDSTTNTTSYYSYTDFERPPAEFAAGFNDYGLDTDGNSLYDFLVIEKEIKVREAGNYRLSGRLESSSGKYIDSDSNYTYLDVGVQSVKFQFYGPSIYDSEESGNFDVNMNLYKTDDWSGLDSTMNTTSYYIYTDFERPPAEFAAGFNDYCVDTDEDGIYNYLVVEAEINVTKAGEYKLGGSLKYPALGEGYPWAEIDSDWNRTHLEVGIHKITLQFDGIGIYNTKYSGSFSVLLSLYEAEEGNRIDEMGYFTNDYDYTDFQRPPAEFAAGFNDYGLDTNGNSLYDYLVIEKEIIVREAGNYQLSGWLESPSGDGVDTKYNNTYLDVGLHSITLKFYGPSIYNSGESGNFNVDMNLYGTYSDSTTNTTSYYSYTDFERPPVEFTAGFNDYGLDTNGNSLYDYLEIEKEILVRDAGNYSLSGSLKLPSGIYIVSDYNYTYLDVGLHSLKLQFYGPSIYNKAESGNFDVDMNLYNRDSGEGLGTTTNTTSYYSYTEFEIPSAEFTGNFNDYGLDTDEDGLYNYLMIESNITVKKVGEYQLYCTLRAPSGSWIGSDSNRTYLDVDIHSITSRFSGHRIQGYNGSFKAELKLQVVEEWAEIDDAEYLTSEYHYTDFDPVMPPAIISLTANPDMNISKDNPAVISTTVTGDYFREIILFAGEKVESNETTNTYELRSYELVPSDEWVIVGNNTYNLTAEWNATAIGSYVEEEGGIYIGCYYATDGINKTYSIVWELPAERKDNELNRTLYLTYGSFLHNGTWYDDAAIGYLPDTEEVEYVFVSSDMVFLNTTDPKLIEEYPNAKSLDPNSKCKFDNLLIKTASNGTIIGFPFGYGGEATRESNELRIGDLKIKKNVPLPAGDYLIGMNVQDEAGNSDFKGTTVFTAGISQVFDTCSGTYPSIAGIHNGTITPFDNLNVSKMYTYPCAGTGGHSKSVRIWGDSVDVSGTWDGYNGDWHNITFSEQVTLLAGHTYNYTLRTGSYPQIHHTANLSTPAGFMTCSEFVDGNGKRYKEGVPAIKLE